MVSQIKAEEERKRALATEWERLASAERIRALDASQIKRDLAARVEDVKALLGRHTPQGRQTLRALLDGKIVMEPVVEDTRRGLSALGAAQHRTAPSGRGLPRAGACGGIGW